ncbi:MAG TPA: TonB-dependent receptor [Longimicrobiaceae bacterium]|nr:TonB-dependent receptor [Longimicrobiaceae bacterium]
MKRKSIAGRRDHGPRPFGVAVLTLAFVGSSILAAAPAAEAQAGTTASLFGRVTDAAGVAVPDVAVILATPGGAAVRTVLTDPVGVYRIVGLEPGTYRLRTQRLGYLAVEHEIALARGESRGLDLALETDAVILQGVVARGSRDTNRERSRFETEPGVTARVVEAQALKVLPGLAEADVLRAIEMLPGVISTSDFSSSFSVRGGSADQNLVLIDGFTVFNPVHLGGLFSVFNSDAVERAELFAGGFGAEFGGRVSSVLNIESRSEVPERVEVAGGISMLASRALVRGPMPGAVPGLLGGSDGSWMLSARRSYFDALLRPVVDFPYHLTDVQGHLAFGTRAGGRLSFTGYWGEDVLDLSKLALDEGSAAAALRLKWDWGNQVLGGRLVQPLARGWIGEMRAGYSRFAEQLAFTDFGDVRFESRIEQRIARGDLSRDLSPALSLRLGLGADRMEHHNLARGGGTTFLESDGSGTLGGAYSSLRWRPERWIIEPGLRLDMWVGAHATHAVLSPRFAAKRFFGPDESVAVKLAVGRYSQFVHSLRDEELPVSNDTWVLAGRDVPVVVSDQVQAGIESFWGDAWSASLEGYFRAFDGVTDLNFAEDPNDPADDLLTGDGRSYGLDLLLRRNEGRLTGWAGLSLLRAERTFPDPLAADWNDLPPTVSYPPIYDRRVNLDLVLQYVAPGDWDFGARWNYGTGLPYTRPVAQYLSWRQHPILGRAEPFGMGFDQGDFPVSIVLGERNAERYPPYHRLDLTVRKSFVRRWGTLVPYLQILNLYNRRNVLFYFYNYDRTPPVRSGFSMFPFLPAVGVEVSF